MKHRQKTIFIGTLLLCIFISSSYVSASGTRIDNITHPDTVKIGKTFEIIASFDYPTTSDCLWGDYIYLYYGVGFNPVIDYRQSITITLPDTPRPINVIIEIDTSSFACEVNDTFIFRVEYTTGMIIGDTVYKSGEILTDPREITITDKTFSTTELIYVYSGSALAGLLLIGLSVYLKKRRN